MLIIYLCFLTQQFVVTDELLLVEIRSPVQEDLSDEALKGPNLEAIAQATSDLPSVQNPPKPLPSTECPADVNIYFYMLIFLFIILFHIFTVSCSSRMKSVRF